jgi:patatin-like phospholipase/acyl hydrolase
MVGAATATTESGIEEELGSDDRRFQVLALDGGGVRGIFTAAILAGLEEDVGSPVVEHFDLVVGTSTGGIIALALGAGLTPRQILEFYVEERAAIFAGLPLLTNLRRLFRAKYRPDGLEAALKRIFGERLLGESRVPLVVPSYNLGENAVYVFKTPHQVRLRRDFRVPMWAVAMATSAAPTYFPAFHLPTDHVRLVDGGVWANNPAMVGVTEAVGMFGCALDEIRVLSVGTTTIVAPRPSKLDDAGLLRWARRTNVVEVLMAGQAAGAFAQVQHMIGPANAHRLNPPAPAELGTLDRCDARELIGKAAHHSRVFAPLFQSEFASHFAAPFTPFHDPHAKAGI